MGPAMTWDQTQQKYSQGFQVVPSFGLHDSGNPKFRRIDDHSASGGNRAAHRLQKVPMAIWWTMWLS